MPIINGFYLESLPTAERRAEVNGAVDRALVGYVKRVGFGGREDVFRRCLTPEELDSIRRSMSDTRNPGSVTMAALFRAWIS